MSEPTKCLCCGYNIRPRTAGILGCQCTLPPDITVCGSCNEKDATITRLTQERDDYAKRIEILIQTIEQQRGKVDTLTAIVQRLREAAKDVPDPEDGGYCASCGQRPELREVEEGGYKAHKYQHLSHCWYGKLTAALTEEAGG